MSRRYVPLTCHSRARKHFLSSSAGKSTLLMTTPSKTYILVISLDIFSSYAKPSHDYSLCVSPGLSASLFSTPIRLQFFKPQWKGFLHRWRGLRTPKAMSVCIWIFICEAISWDREQNGHLKNFFLVEILPIILGSKEIEVSHSFHIVSFHLDNENYSSSHQHCDIQVWMMGHQALQ